MNEHVGGAVVAVAPFSVMLLQERVTSALNPPPAVMLIVEVADPPGDTEEGESAVPETEKPETTSVSGTVNRFDPEVPVTLTG